ncbi:DUF4198 domain-containing protein [Reyranella sp.]|uniref:DUF4198 domain-containing protein n=1 Tax=Reyranella sp. TaxID=1929291 RepID=UPI0037851BBC
MSFLSRLAVVASVGASVLAFSPVAASAHHLWLESSEAGTHVYFGEFGENLREVSPGRLDRLQPQAKAVSATGEQALAVDKSPTGFVVTGKIDKGDSVIAADLRSPVQARTRDGVTTRSLYRPAARFVPDFSPRKPALELDIVPAGDGKFQVFFKGKPLAKSKVEVISASGWVREERTGEDGGFAVALPWRGIYVIEVQYADKTPGKQGEDAYDVANYVTTLTVMQPQGLDPLPAPPPAKPN